MARIKSDWLFSYYNSMEKDPKVMATAAAGYAVASELGILHTDTLGLPFHREKECSLPFFAEDYTLNLMREIKIEAAMRSEGATPYDIPLGVLSMMALGPVCLAQGEAGDKLFDEVPSAFVPLDSADAIHSQEGAVLVDLHRRSYKALDACGESFKLQVLYLIPVEWAERNLHYYMVIGLGAAKFHKYARAYFMLTDDGHFDEVGTERLYKALQIVAPNSFMANFPRQKGLEWAGFHSLCSIMLSHKLDYELTGNNEIHAFNTGLGARAMTRTLDESAVDYENIRESHQMMDDIHEYLSQTYGAEPNDATEAAIQLYKELIPLKSEVVDMKAYMKQLALEFEQVRSVASSDDVRKELDASIAARTLAERRVVDLERELAQIRSQERADVVKIDRWKGEAERLSTQLRQAQAFREAVDVMALPTCCIESLLLAESLWSDRLVITEAARKSAEDFVNGDFREMFTHLQALAVVLWPIIFEEKVTNPQEEFQNRSSVEMTFKTNRRVKESMFDDEYMIEYKGERVRMDPHTKGKNKRRGYALRVHFFFDHEDKKIVIGHAGDHLRTTLTPKLH